MTKVLLAFAVVMSLCASCTPRQPEECYARGQALLQSNERLRAYKYFLKAAKKAPDNPRYHWAAAQSAKNANAAYIHAQSAWDLGMKSQQVMYLILRTNKLSSAMDLYHQLPDTSQTGELLGELHYNFGSADSSVLIWKEEFNNNPSAGLCTKLALAYQKSGNSVHMLTTLDRCRSQKLLDQKGYAILAILYGAEFQSKKIDTLFSEAKKAGLYDNFLQRQRAAYYCSRRRFALAEAILLPLANADAASPDERREARLLLGFICMMSGEKEKLARIKKMIADTSSNDNPELVFYNAIGTFLASKPLPPETIAKLVEFFPNKNAVTALCARAWYQSGNHEATLKALDRLRDFFVSSPAFLVLRSAALAGLGKTDEALSFINTLHSKRIITRKSLILLRDLCLKKGLTDQSLAAQRLLEKEFPGDRDLLLQSGRLAEQTGKSQEALKIYKSLSQKYPDDYRFELSRIRLLFRLKDFSRVITECRRSQLPDTLLTSYLAGALGKTGQVKEAEKIYSTTLAGHESPSLLLEYADFLVQQGNMQEAVNRFSQALERHGERIKKNPTVFASLLNNYAWALSQLKPFKAKTSLQAIEQANKLLPDNPRLLDTYATILLKADQTKKCVSLLRDHSQTKKEPALLIHLAAAYEKQKDHNSASRTYKMALEIYDGKHIVPIKRHKSEIQKAIERIDDTAGK